jgi:hypothetical protein
MGAGVTDCAKCDQVCFGVIPKTTPKFLVVNFQVRHPAARLTPPAIATQDLLPEALIGGSD